MTNQEKLELIEEVCERVRAKLENESKRLDAVAEGWKDKNSAMYFKCKDNSTNTLCNKMCVTAVETEMTMELIRQATESDDIRI